MAVGPQDGKVLVPGVREEVRGRGLQGLGMGRGRGRPRTANFEFSWDAGGQGRPGRRSGLGRQFLRL